MSAGVQIFLLFIFSYLSHLFLNEVMLQFKYFFGYLSIWEPSSSSRPAQSISPSALSEEKKSGRPSGPTASSGVLSDAEISTAPKPLGCQVWIVLSGWCSIVVADPYNPPGEGKPYFIYSYLLNIGKPDLWFSNPSWP